MNVTLPDELEEFVKRKMAEGQYASEEAVIEEGLKRLRDQELGGRTTAGTLDDLVDQEFVEYCGREADDGITLKQVLEATSTIKDSMARAIIDEERAERF